MYVKNNSDIEKYEFNNTFEVNGTWYKTIDLVRSLTIPNLTTFDNFQFIGDYLITTCPTCEANAGTIKVY